MKNDEKEKRIPLYSIIHSKRDGCSRIRMLSVQGSCCAKAGYYRVLWFFICCCLVGCVQGNGNTENVQEEYGADTVAVTTKEDTVLVSPFIGSWDWVKNDEFDQFSIDIGERNDSILIAMGGVFCNGNKIQTPDYLDDGTTLAQIKVPMHSERNYIQGLISPVYIRWFYYGEKCAPGVATFELLNDTTMYYTLTNNISYWPDRAYLVKAKYYKKRKFSYSEEDLVYEK